MKKYYPIMIDIENKLCTVVGGGKVAERKIISLLEHRAKVIVISPEITLNIRELETAKDITCIKREYVVGDLVGSYLVYVATTDLNVSRACRQEALAENIMINVVDIPELCDFIVPAVVKRGDLTISVSTNGKSPMLAKRVREELEEDYGAIYGEYIGVLGELRKVVMEEIQDINLRGKIFHTLVYSDEINHALIKQSSDIKAKAFEIYKNFKDKEGVE